MFDFIRNLGRSDEQRQQEALSAYLDDELAPEERTRVEQELVSNGELQNELAEMQLWQAQMRNLPTRRVPRNFTLDPAVYGRPQRRSFAGAYPVLRTATAVAAFLFVIALAANLYLGGFVNDLAPVPAAEPLMSTIAEVAVTRADDTIAAESAAMTTAEAFELEEPEGAEAGELDLPVVEEAEEGEVMEAAEAAESVEEIIVEEEPASEPEVAEGEELLSEKPQEAPVLELEPVDEALLQPQEFPESAAAAQTDEMQDAEIAAAEEALKAQEEPRSAIPATEAAPPQTAAPEQAQPQEAPLADEQQFLQPPADDAAELPADEQQFLQPPADEGAAPPAEPSIFPSVSPLVLGLGLLFILLTVLTMLARGRR